LLQGTRLEGELRWRRLDAAGRSGSAGGLDDDDALRDRARPADGAEGDLVVERAVARPSVLLADVHDLDQGDAGSVGREFVGGRVGDDESEQQREHGGTPGTGRSGLVGWALPTVIKHRWAMPTRQGGVTAR